MAVFLDTLDKFTSGVVTSGEPDEIPVTASPRAWNAYLADAGPDGATPSTRRGLSTVNTTQIAATPIHAQFAYRRLSSGVYTRYHLILGVDGKMGHVASDPGGAGTYTSISATAFTASSPRPDIKQAANMAFFLNGTDAKKLRETTLETFGIVAPSTAPTLAGGGAGTPTGTYEARVTYYNSNTGHESSAGPTSSTVTVTADEIDFTSVPVSADSQVTHRRIYIRNVNSQANFYQAGTIADNSTTTFTWDAADTTLVTRGPDEDENDPPPTGVRVLAWHRARMFVADDTKLYYSKVGFPEAFDPENYEYVAPNDGQKITALFSYGDLLLVFKERALYGLFGVDPEIWQLRLISADIGCTSHQSVTSVDTTLFWWSEKGPVRWLGLGARPELIGQATLRDQLTPSTLAFGELDEVVAAVDPVQEHVLFGVAELGKTRNTMVLPWSYRLNCWVSSKWDPLGGVASLHTVWDDTGRPWVYYGSYAGQVFRAWDTDVDGVPSGTTTGSVTASGTTMSTITSTGFYTTGSALVERMVSLVDTNGLLMGRRYITTNSATVLTLDSAITGLTNGASYTFYVGGPNFEWDTKQHNSGGPWSHKRYDFLYAQLGATSSTIHLHALLDFETAASFYTTRTFTSSTRDTVTARIRIARTGSVWQARVICRGASSPINIQALGVRGMTLSDKVR
jgi:hypothetical protein